MAGFTGVLTAVCTALVAMVAYLGVHEHQLSNDVALLRAALVQGSIADQAGAVPAHTLHKRQLVLTGTGDATHPRPSCRRPVQQTVRSQKLSLMVLEGRICRRIQLNRRIHACFAYCCCQLAPSSGSPSNGTCSSSGERSCQRQRVWIPFCPAAAVSHQPSRWASATNNSPWSELKVNVTNSLVWPRESRSSASDMYLTPSHQTASDPAVHACRTCRTPVHTHTRILTHMLCMLQPAHVLAQLSTIWCVPTGQGPSDIPFFWPCGGANFRTDF